MIALPGALDTLLADKLAQRADLVRLPLWSIVPGPGPSQPVDTISRDTGLRADPSDRPSIAADHGAPPSAMQAAAAASHEQHQEFSAAARAISALLAELDPVDTAVQAVHPLVDQPPLQADHRLPQALFAALSNSGLFYESHLAALAAGALQPRELADEPQSRVAPRHDGSAMPHGQLLPPASITGERNATSGAPLIAPQVKLLVSQQLQLLATGVFQWRGQAWPGVPMEWRVERQPRRDAASAEIDGPSRWSTTIVLPMSTLGRIEARITMAGAAVGVHLQANAGASGHLRADAASLRERLRSAGLQAPQVAVSEVEAP